MTGHVLRDDNFTVADRGPEVDRLPVGTHSVSLEALAGRVFLGRPLHRIP